MKRWCTVSSFVHTIESVWLGRIESNVSITSHCINKGRQIFFNILLPFLTGPEFSNSISFATTEDVDPNPATPTIFGKVWNSLTDHLWMWWSPHSEGWEKHNIRLKHPQLCSLGGQSAHKSDTGCFRKYRLLVQVGSKVLSTNQS